MEARFRDWDKEIEQYRNGCCVVLYLTRLLNYKRSYMRSRVLTQWQKVYSRSKFEPTFVHKVKKKSYFFALKLYVTFQYDILTIQVFLIKITLKEI